MIRHFIDEHDIPYALGPGQTIEGVTLTPITAAVYVQTLQARTAAAAEEEAHHQRAAKAAATNAANRKKKVRALLPALQAKLTALGFTAEEIELLINPIN